MCFNLLYAVFSFCSWSLSTTGTLRALLEYLDVTCYYCEVEFGTSHHWFGSSLQTVIHHQSINQAPHVNFGGDSRFYTDSFMRFGDVNSLQYFHLNSVTLEILVGLYFGS